MRKQHTVHNKPTKSRFLYGFINQVFITIKLKEVTEKRQHKLNTKFRWKSVFFDMKVVQVR